jgi:hypothetical protein
MSQSEFQDVGPGASYLAAMGAAIGELEAFGQRWSGTVPDAVASWRM